MTCPLPGRSITARFELALSRLAVAAEDHRATLHLARRPSAYGDDRSPLRPHADGEVVMGVCSPLIADNASIAPSFDLSLLALAGATPAIATPQCGEIMHIAVAW